MKKFLTGLALILIIVGIAAGGFALFKYLNPSSEKISNSVSDNDNAETSNTSENTTSQEKRYSIGDNQYIAFENKSYIFFDYSVTQSPIKIVDVDATIKVRNLSFDNLKVDFKYPNGLDARDYITVSYTIDEINNNTKIDFSVAFNEEKDNEIPSTIFVSLTSKTNNFQPYFEIQYKNNYSDEIFF